MMRTHLFWPDAALQSADNVSRTLLRALRVEKTFQVDKHSMLSSLRVHLPLVADGLGQLSNLLERAQLLCIRDWHGDLGQTVVTGL